MRYSRRLLEKPSPLHEVNGRCLAMLMQSARQNRPGGISLVLHLKDLLLRLTPEAQQRAAQSSILLTDIHFANPSWWRTAKTHPMRPAPLSSWQGGFPRTAAVQLARATLMLCWHGLRSHPQDAVLLGISAPVAEVIEGLSLTEIDHIVDRRFRHLRPRWEDRPAVWRALLLAAESEDFRKTRDFSLYSLQLVTGALWPSTPPTRQGP